MHFITSFYFFKPIKDLKSFQSLVEEKASALHLKGLVILADEGMNATLSGKESAIEAMEDFVKENQGIPIEFKRSESQKKPFRRFKVKLKDEIVTSSHKASPKSEKTHLSPERWHELLTHKKEDIFLIDARNWYETEIGKFKGSLDLHMENFNEWEDKIKKTKIPKNKKILIYCTGGIRCEKGIESLKKLGYENSYQLKGGILKYLKEYPEGEFEGECFVFDHRVSVDKKGHPSKTYLLCPHSGQPAKHPLTCVRCGKETKVSHLVLEDPVKSTTCSKNCAHQWKIHPGKKGKRQII